MGLQLSGNQRDVSELAIRQDFESGNFVKVSRSGHLHRWETHAARGLLGRTQEALEGLSRFSCEQSRFYRGVTCWIDGDDERALYELRRCSLSRAGTMVNLLEKPFINVLAQLQWPVSSIDDPKFRVTRFGYGEGELRNLPYSDVRAFLDPAFPPDFYICGMIEAADVPLNIGSLSCPIFGATADYDAHIQITAPWLKVFDQLVVVAEEEWNDVRLLSGRPTSTFSKIYGISPSDKPMPVKERDIDVFISGTLIHPYHQDKFEVINEVLKMDGLKVHISTGFIPPSEYHQLLSRTKVAFTYIRRADGMPTRGLEALAHGAAVIVQKGCVLADYYSEAEGVFEYSGAASLAGRIREVVGSWDSVKYGASAGADRVRGEFGRGRTLSQFLRYLTFLASDSRSHRETRPADNLSQKELLFFRGPNPGAAVRDLRRKENASRWLRELGVSPSPAPVISLARELTLEWALQTHPAALRTRGSQEYRPHVREDTFSLYRKSLDLFPNSLVLRFNFVRTALHFGEVKEVEAALDLAQDTLAKPLQVLSLDLLEDVFPFDFFSVGFNYRLYFDTVTETLKSKTLDHGALKALIFASLSSYLGHYVDPVENFRRAVELDPSHHYYQLALSEALVRSGERQSLIESARILVKLSENSHLFLEAAKLLQLLEAEGVIPSDALEPLNGKMRNYNSGHNAGGYYNEDIAELNLRPLPIRYYWKCRPIKEQDCEPRSAKAGEARRDRRSHAEVELRDERRALRQLL